MNGMSVLHGHPITVDPDDQGPVGLVPSYGFYVQNAFRFG